MAIKTRNVERLAVIGQTPVRLNLGTTAISQTALVTDSFTIPYPFQITSVEVYSTTVTATITVDVAIGATSALSAVITPVAATKVSGALSATTASLRSTAATGVINLKYTSNGTGAATGLVVVVWFRPLGMHGDVAAIAA